MYRTRPLLTPLTAEALQELKEAAAHHALMDVRDRARGVMALNAGHAPSTVAQILGVTARTVYNWAKWWNAQGLAGLLGGHNGGRPPTLTPAWVEAACEIAREEPLTLNGIKQRLRERHPDMPDVSADRLAVRLKERGLRFNRCRLSLKKSAMKSNSRQRTPS